MKYEFTGETIIYAGVTLRRIRSLISIPHMVSAGYLGGFIEKTENLSHSGDCWVFPYSNVYGDACVGDDARVCGFSRVYGSSKCLGRAKVYSSAHVYDNAMVCGDVVVDGCARVYGNSYVGGRAVVCGDARVYGSSLVYGNAKVCGDAHVFGMERIKDFEVVSSGKYFGGKNISKITFVACGMEFSL